jgi:preprotein translocase subunit YajC
MLASLLLAAEETTRETQPGWASFVPFLLILPVLYLIMIRPARRQEQQRQMLLSQVKKNDKVVTTAGIIGTVVGVSETEDEVTVKVDDNTRLKMLKSAIARNVTQEEALKAQTQKKS